MTSINFIERSSINLSNRKLFTSTEQTLKQKSIITVFVLGIALLSALSASIGIFSAEGGGPYRFRSVRGKEVMIYGKGIYRHMSAEVAPQGIAQDYVTLFLGIPLLLVSLFMARRGSLRGRFLLTGVVGYFLVTYLFYLVMGMYNDLFLAYVVLLALSFYTFLLLFQSFNTKHLFSCFNENTPVKFAGGFLVFNAVSIAFLWLSIVVPPLLDGTVVPVQTEHYTTLIVQGIDLAILLPGSFISGVLFYRKRNSGYLWAPVYFVFLSLLMTALTAKVAAMAMLGYAVIPAIYIIPTFNLASILGTILILKKIRDESINIPQKGVYDEPVLTK
ncbi:MAG: hypothetical protein JWR72_547 [Flavisolibacter sp.]|nr:hypothetical protein [Flavisolibacter sp.]